MRMACEVGMDRWHVRRGERDEDEKRVHEES